MSLTIDIAQELQEQLRTAADRAGLSPDAYAANILTQHLSKQVAAVSESEAELLQQINVGLSEEKWQRYHQLRQKLEDGTLPQDEQQELLGITDEIERANVHRIEALIKLADLRNTTLDALMDELGVRPPAYT